MTFCLLSVYRASSLAARSAALVLTASVALSMQAAQAQESGAAQPRAVEISPPQAAPGQAETASPPVIAPADAVQPSAGPRADTPSVPETVGGAQPEAPGAPSSDIATPAAPQVPAAPKPALSLLEDPAGTLSQMLEPVERDAGRDPGLPHDLSPWGMFNRRDRALVALIMLTGARDDAVASARLKHLDLAERQLFQDPREMRTKFRKTISTWFFPVGEDFATIVTEWKTELLTVHGFGPDDPLFPKTAISFGPDGDVLTPGLGCTCWANADPIRKVFKAACAAASLPYFNPHSLRHTLAQLAGSLCTTPEQYKAWSQNLGHKDVLTTLTSYGTVPGYRQRDLIRSMGAIPPK